jgi:hypothetical protein
MHHEWEATTGSAHSVKSTFIHEYKNPALELSTAVAEEKKSRQSRRYNHDLIDAYLDNKITRKMACSRRPLQQASEDVDHTYGV